ncbi:MAG TPA: dethiobiotin synthase [Candidatus Gastranaerophilales bacterium]|nr:dethiobiotin synthase [Candidatus Gastranaerophilales bacterium]
MNIFIAGTDTGVGKTVVTAGIAAVMQSLGYAMGVYKPVQSGAIYKDGELIAPDIEFVKSIDSNIKTKVSYNFKPAVAPSLAALLENSKIYKNRLKIDYESMKECCDFVIVEGAGGLLVPLSDDFMVRDLIKLLELPVLLVARPDLGTINHTLLTIEAAKAIGLEILGVIISNYPVETDDIAIKTAPDIISELTGVKIIGILPSVKEIKENKPNQAEALIDMVINNIDVQEIFRLKIPKLAL